ncbi:MAG: protein NosL [bacterium]|nr:protein NosL [bacterium]
MKLFSRYAIAAGAGILICVGILGGCSRKDETGPGEVRWDRDTCALCIMAVSDHNYAAQIRGGVAGKRTKLAFFDDLGCAVLWLDEQDWKSDPRTEIWVTDWRDGTWLEAPSAWYLPGKVTPMDFGLGAQLEKTDETLNYEQAVDHIRNRNQKAH